MSGEWRRSRSEATIRIQGWSAEADASSTWAAQAGPVELISVRRDLGLLASFERRSAGSVTRTGVRAEASRTAYQVASGSGGEPVDLRARTPVVAVFAEHAAPIGSGFDLSLAASVGAAAGSLRLAPRADLSWKSGEYLQVTGSYSRSYQSAQSLRNAESVVSTIFPVDLYIGSGAPGVPTARSDLAALEADFRPAAGVQLRAQAYLRAFRGLLLVAPGEGEPFLTGTATAGAGMSRGASIDAVWSTRSLRLVAGYGAQRVRRSYGAASYAPDYGTSHLLEGGLTLFPAGSFSLRLGGAAALGRRTTLVSGALTSESCNLLDRGCEFGGSPNHSGQSLGGVALPGYFRLDLGARKHWSVKVRGRSAQVALFASVTNLSNRKNILTYSRNLPGGPLIPIELRPIAPLLVGLDWKF